jgi:hypothetical protein
MKINIFTSLINRAQGLGEEGREIILGSLALSCALSLSSSLMFRLEL